jgi:hypothetical protein
VSRPAPQRNSALTENSSIFSLQQLTQHATKTTPASRDEDSGLIDLQKIEASGATLAQPVPAAPVYAAPPPLRLPVEESTLTAMVAVSVEQRHPRLKWAALFFGVCLLSVGLGTFLAGLGSNPAPAAASAPLIIYVPAPTGSALEASNRDVPGTAASAQAREVNAASTIESPSTVTPLAVGEKVPGTAPGSRSRTTRPLRKPPAQVANTPPSSRDKPTKKRPADPCAHCAGDLSCAMRCSVTRP